MNNDYVLRQEFASYLPINANDLRLLLSEEGFHGYKIHHHMHGVYVLVKNNYILAHLVGGGVTVAEINNLPEFEMFKKGGGKRKTHRKRCKKNRKKSNRRQR